MRGETLMGVLLACFLSLAAWGDGGDNEPARTPLSASSWSDAAGNDEVAENVAGNRANATGSQEPEQGEAPPAAEAAIGAEMSIFDVNQIELLDLQKIEEQVSALLSTNSVRLSLHDCVVMALSANQDILISFYEPQKSYGDFVGAKGEFDPTLTADYSWTESALSASPQIQAFGGINSIENETWQGQLSLGGRLHWGTQYSVSIASDFERGTFSQFTGQYRSALVLSLTQPLLRGRGKAVNLAQIRSAKNSVAISEEQVKLTVLTTLGEVMKSYWDLVGAVETLRVRDVSLENAKRLVEINQRRLDIGTAAVIEVIASKAGVATRISDYVTARTAIADAEDILKNNLSMREGELFSSERIIPIDRPSEIDFVWNPERSMRLALENRPDIRTAELTIANAEIERKRARNALLPQVDLNANLTYGGRDVRLEETFNGIRQKQDEVTTYGITASIPLGGNRAARGAHRRARLNVEQERQRLEATKNSIMQGARIAGRSVVSSLILIESNRTTVILQETNVVAEMQRLSLGTSTSHQVLEVQEDLTLAQTQEVQARINAEKALIDLQVAEGTLLENLGLEFELPARTKPLNTIESLTYR